MKKVLFFTLLLLTAQVHLKAQPASSYFFSSTIQEYKPLSGGTVLGEKLYSDLLNEKLLIGDSGISVPRNGPYLTQGIPIGFDFEYCGLSMKNFAVISNGMVFLGTDSVLVGINKTGMLSSANTNFNNQIVNCYSGFIKSSDTISTPNPVSKISYKTEEDGLDGKVLIIQYENILMRTNNNNAAGPFDTLNFQFRLYESDNRIEIAYSSCKKSQGNNEYFRVGIRGNGSTDADLHVRTTTTDYTKTTKGTKNSNCVFSRTVYPANNLLYSFTPPSACKTPAAPTALTFTKITGNSLAGSFTKGLETDQYMIVISEGVLTGSPTDKKTYAVNDAIGNGVIKKISAENTFLVKDLQPSTNYTISVFSSNYLCSNGPSYSVSALADVTRTNPAPPTIEIVKVDTQSIGLNFTPNAENDEIILLCHTTENIVFPSGVLSLNDTLSNGAKVVYKGVATSASIEGLNNSTAYYFSAWSIKNQSDTIFYTSEYAKTNAHTWAKIPIVWDFNNEPDRWENGKVPVLPCGWSRLLIDGDWQNNFRVTNSTANDIYMQGFLFFGQTPREADSTDVITPNILVEKGLYRILFDYRFIVPGFIGDEPYALGNGDSLCVQISDENGNFQTIYTIDKTNYTPGMLPCKAHCTFESTQTQTVRARFVYNAKLLSTVILDNIKAEKVFDCDYPTNVLVKDSTITTSCASLSWTENNDNTPDSWNARFRVVGTELWSDAQNMTNQLSIISGLPPQAYIEVQVQSACSAENYSPWSDPSPAFLTQYSIPFTCDFSDWDPMWQYTNTIKPYWGETTGLFTSADFVVNPEEKNSKWKIGNWRGRYGSSAYSCDFAKSASAWFFTPAFDLGNEQANTIFSFDFSLNPQNKQQTVDSINSQARFLVAISTDGGKTFQNENIVASWGKGSDIALAHLDSVPVSIDLSAYRGNVRIGFYVENPLAANANRIFVDNIAVRYSCGQPEKLETLDIGEDSVNLKWESPNDGKLWIIRYRKGSDVNYQYFGAQNTSTVLKGLSIETDYIWSVAEICKDGDTSIWVNNSFNTLAKYVCDTVSGAKPASLGCFDATLKWEGNAETYTVAYKEAQANSWIFLPTTTKTIKLVGLKAETKYTYKVKSHCSENATDTSVWISPRFFTTLINTCTPPQDIQVSNLKNSSVELSYSGKAGFFEISLYPKNQMDQNIVIGIEVNPYTISNLMENTEYGLKMRSICNVGDTSAWSNEISFQTASTAKCPAPKNLNVYDITPVSVTLKWDTEEAHQTWNICYKTAENGLWDTTFSHSANSYSLSNLKQNSSYTWGVQASCANEEKSLWVLGSNFSTPLSLETNSKLNNAFIVFSVNHAISIKNVNQVQIEHLSVQNIMGQKEFDYSPHSCGDIVVPCTFSKGIHILKIYSEKQSYTYKLFVK